MANDVDYRRTFIKEEEINERDTQNGEKKVKFPFHL